ncbi:hypothetical protein GCM10027589_07610 [Actinocorallia lasiicapitis]
MAQKTKRKTTAQNRPKPKPGAKPAPAAKAKAPAKAEAAPKAEAVEAEPAPKTAAVAEPAEPKGRDRLRWASAALALAALACAIWTGQGWYAAAHDTDLRYSEVRDEVLAAASQQIQNLGTLDHRTAEADLNRWQDASTGALYQQIVQGRTSALAALAEAKTVTTAKVLELGLTELDDHAGKARLLVAESLSITPPSGAPQLKFRRLIAELTRTATGWKVSGLGEPPTPTQ